MAYQVAGEVVGSKAPRSRAIPMAADPLIILRHSIRGTIHYAHKASSEKLGCGKARSALYERFGQVADGLLASLRLLLS